MIIAWLLPPTVTGTIACQARPAGITEPCCQAPPGARNSTFAWAVLNVPAVQRVLGTGPVAPEIFALAWLGIPLILGLDWLRKFIAFRRTVPLGRG